MEKSNNLLTNTAIVVFNQGAFGGAAKRYTLLFLLLNKLYPGKFYYFINYHLFYQIKDIFTNIPLDRIKIIDFDKKIRKPDISTTGLPKIYSDNISDPLITDKNTGILRKIFWFYKNKFRVKSLFKQIEKYRKELNIKVFTGVFAGVLPLVFYMGRKTQKRPSVIFANMDSWFSEVHSDMKKLWYRKYYSFNFAMENCDVIDFLSPYILEGVKERNVIIKESSVSVAPCSFTDYSKCFIGNKSKIEIAFSSRLEPDKNPMIYLEAAKSIAAKYPFVKFHLLGEGTLVNKIKTYIEMNNLTDKVNFRFHNNPPEILAETSIFVSIQSNTNYPSQSVLEAMACGNAIIASNTGDTKLFIHNENGILIGLTKEELISALEKLINDSVLTKNLGTNAREFAIKNHTEEKYVKYFMGLIQKAVLTNK